MGWTNSDGTLTNKGQWGVGLGTTGIMVAGDVFAGYQAGKAQKYVNQTMSDISDIQAKAELQKALKEDLYRNEAEALKGWGVARELRALKGSQKVAQAASGTYGPGDDRPGQDAEAKAYRQTRDMLRALQLESFERNNAALIAYYGYKGKASQYRIAAKNAVRNGVLGGIASGINDTTKYAIMASTFWKKGGDAQPYKSKQEKTVNKSLSSNYNPNKLNLYGLGYIKEPQKTRWF